MTRHRLFPRALATGATLTLLLCGAASAQSYRYAPPPPPVQAWGAPAWGQPYGAGNWSHVTGYSYGYAGVGQPYAPVQPYAYYGGHPAYGGAYPYDWRRHDRGGRYGYSVRHEERRSGYRDRWGYNDDRPPTSRRYGDDRPYADYRSDCDCRDVYLYDR